MTTKNRILSNPEMTLAELKSEIVSDLQAGKSLLGQGGLTNPINKISSGSILRRRNGVFFR